MLWFRKLSALALVLLATASALHSQERTTSVILEVPSVNVQQIFAYGEQRGFFKHGWTVDDLISRFRRVDP